MISHPNFHGVYKINEFNQKWFAQLRYKTMNKQLGMFDTDKLAAKGYDAMVIRLHLEDVLDLNFPPEPEFVIRQTILCLNAGLGIPVSNSATGIARGYNLILPMINPNLLLSMAISKLIRLHVIVKREGTLACNKAARGAHDTMNFHLSNKGLYNG